MKYFRILRSIIMSMNAFKAKDLSGNAIYLMPYRGGAIYMVKWPASYTLMHTNAKGNIIFTTGGSQVNKEGIDAIAYEFILKADPRLFIAIALKDMLLSCMHPSIIYSFMASRGLTCNKDSLNLLKEYERETIVKLMEIYERAPNKIGLLEGLRSINYNNMIKYVDETHVTLCAYFSDWIQKEKINEIENRADDIALSIQKTLKDSNSYSEYKNHCLIANVPKDCVLCLPALSRVYALALVRSNKLLKDYNTRPKDSDLMSILHTTERGLVGLKIKFSRDEESHEYGITVGSAFINHNDISGTKDVGI